MAIAFQSNSNVIDTVYSQQTQFNINVFIQFRMEDSPFASEKHEPGTPLYGKKIFVAYSFQTPIGNIWASIANQIRIDNEITILSETTYRQEKAMELWNQYVVPYSEQARLDLSTKCVFILRNKPTQN